MRRPFSNSNRSRRGQSLIEMGLVLALFMMFWLGILNWAFTFFIHQTLTWRASEAARWAATHCYPDSGGLSGQVSSVQNIVNCGSPGCSGSDNLITLLSATVTVNAVTATDTQVGTNQDRWYAVVKVTGYTIPQWTPFFYNGNISGRPIVAAHPIECRLADCSDSN